MNKIFNPPIIVTIIFISVLISACKKSEDTTDTAPPTTTTNASNYYFRCKINGVDWAATVPTGNDTDYFGSTVYLINNKTSAISNQLAMSVLPFDSVTWGLESASYIDNSFNIFDANFSMTTLQLSVSKDSIHRIITGTFSFPLVDLNDDTLKFTNGAFRVRY